MQFLCLHPKQKLMDYFGHAIAQEIDRAIHGGAAYMRMLTSIRSRYDAIATKASLLATDTSKQASVAVDSRQADMNAVAQSVVLPPPHSSSAAVGSH